MTLTSGSLCSGYGGLDIAVEAVFGARTMWVSEIDEAASRVLAARFPDAPNLGDLRMMDPPAVDILTGGFPCQPVSNAGGRAGVDDERWLFDDICELLGRMGARPRLCVFENVPGLLTANDGDAMARVVRGLAQVGYVGSWRTVAASDVGACHRRERVFVVATDSDGPGQGGPTRWSVEHEVRYGTSDGYPLSADSEGLGCDGDRHPRPGGAGFTDGRFGPYDLAVRRWERVIGRPAPSPRDDRGRLAAKFVEWMMGVPAGWVTDVLTNRGKSIPVLGNGVVPQQAAYAIRGLL